MPQGTRAGGKAADDKAIGRWRLEAIRLGMFPQVFDRYVAERGLDYVITQYQHLRGNPNKPRPVTGALWMFALREDVKAHDEKSRADVEAFDADRRKQHDERAAQIVAARRQAELDTDRQARKEREEFARTLSALADDVVTRAAEEVEADSIPFIRRVIVTARQSGDSPRQILSKPTVMPFATDWLVKHGHLQQQTA